MFFVIVTGFMGQLNLTVKELIFHSYLQFGCERNVIWKHLVQICTCMFLVKGKEKRNILDCLLKEYL